MLLGGFCYLWTEPDLLCPSCFQSLCLAKLTCCLKSGNKCISQHFELFLLIEALELFSLCGSYIYFSLYGMRHNSFKISHGHALEDKISPLAVSWKQCRQRIHKFKTCFLQAFRITKEYVKNHSVFLHRELPLSPERRDGWAC